MKIVFMDDSPLTPPTLGDLSIGDVFEIPKYKDGVICVCLSMHHDGKYRDYLFGSDDSEPMGVGNDIKEVTVRILDAELIVTR